MDRKFDSDTQWGVSQPINLRQFLEQAAAAKAQLEESVGKDACSSRKPILESRIADNFASRANCNRATAKKIFTNDLKIENFVKDSRILMMTFDERSKIEPSIRPNDFRTHHHLQKREEWCNVSKQRKSAYVKSLKYDRFKSNDDSLKQLQAAPDAPCDLDLVITVSALVPHNKILSNHELRNSRLLLTQTKFVVRGNMLLSELRKKIVCVCDQVTPLPNGLELQRPVDMSNATSELFPSAFIFVHDTFYVDLSHPNAEDISAPIREFMGRKNIFDPVKGLAMEGVRIVDLTLRQGLPYVFQHSGTCEHLLIFHDLRLLHPNDVQEIERYPIVIYDKPGERKCDACKRENAEFIVEGSEQLPQIFTYFCDTCFSEFNFTNGVKNANFQAWPFLELSSLRFT